MTDWSGYSDEQLAAIRSESSRVVVLSVAGSGKTRVVAGRILWLVENSVPPSHIIALTYTVAAAKVLLDRVKVKLQYCGTLHSLCLRLVNRHADLVGFSPGVGVVDAAAAEALLERVCKEQRYKAGKLPLEQALRKWPSALGNPTPAQTAVAAYRRLLRNNNAVDFDGLLHWGLVVLQQKGGAHWMANTLLVDELQDASDDHFAIYEAMPVDARFYCGDKNQSIFSFLGGNVNNIVAAAAKDTMIHRLSTNYRCCKAVCAAATKLVAAGGGDEKVLPRTDAPEGRCEVASYSDAAAEVLGVVKKIRELECEKSCAVLLRTNAQVQEWSMALEGYGLPVAAKRRQEPPPDWAAVRALLAALNSVDNDLTAAAFIAATRGQQAAEAVLREAQSRMVSVNELSLHLPHLETATEALAFAAAQKPSAAALERLQAAAALLDESATPGDLVLALSEPERQEVVSAGVTTCTYHSAKGCEWNTVMIPCAEEGIIPSNRTAADPAALAEERRVFYVGVTRAEQNLFISWCRTRQERWGRREEAARQCSRFVSECGLVEA